MGLFDDLKKPPSVPTRTAPPVVKTPATKTSGGLFDDLKTPPKPTAPAPIRPMAAPKALPIVAQRPLVTQSTPPVPTSTISAPTEPLKESQGGYLKGNSYYRAIKSADQAQQELKVPSLKKLPEPAKPGVGNFVKQTGTVALSQGANAAKFAEDYIQNNPLTLLGAGGNILNGILPKKEKTPEEIAQRDKNSIFAPIAKDFQEQGAALNTESEAWKKASTKEKFSKEHILETIYNTAPQVAGSAISFITTGGTGGFLISAGSTAEDVKQKARAAGVSETNAEKIGLATGLAVGLIDKLSFDKIIPEGVKAKVAKGIVSRVTSLVKSGAIEATTEAIQENIQLAAEATFRKDLGWDEVVTRNVMSAFGGLLGGVGFHSAGSTIGEAPIADQSFELKDGQMVPIQPEAPVASKAEDQSFELKDNKMVPIATASEPQGMFADLMAPKSAQTANVGAETVAAESAQNQQTSTLPSAEQSPAVSVPEQTTQPLQEQNKTTIIPPKKSAVGKSIEAKAIERGLAASFSESAQYDPVTVKDQANRAAELIKNDIEQAKRIVLGEERLPNGLLGGTMIKAMEDYALANGDAKLALDIANSPLTAETSVHAQEMRMLAERDPSSAVANIQKLKKMKEESASKKAGEKKEKIAKEVKESIKKVTKQKATKETWESFITSITC